MPIAATKHSTAAATNGCRNSTCSLDASVAKNVPSCGPSAKPNCMQLCTSENASVRRWSSTRLLAAA
jgi:hypothetical protein